MRQVAGRNYPPTNKNTLIRALTEELDKLLQQLLDNVVQMKKNTRLNACEIATDIHEKFNENICADTARKILKKAGYRSRVPRRKPSISMTNRLKRIAFVKEHIHKPPEFWRTVIFSDEGKFCIFGIKGCILIWNKPCTNLIGSMKMSKPSMHYI
ncbi:transposable element Tc1 transposase [Trichonephila clavipes]|nr:transposable element Tc1 transposase [Trichonephila clavipes]